MVVVKQIKLKPPIMGLKQNNAFCSESKKVYQILSKSSFTQVKLIYNFSLKYKH